MSARHHTGSGTFIAAAIGMAIAVAVVYSFFVRTSDGQRIDSLALDGAEIGQQALQPFTLAVLDIVPTVAVAIAVVVTVIIVAMRRNWAALIVGTGAALAANVTTQLLKSAILDRPDLGIESNYGNSLPSGHTTLAGSAALVVFIVSNNSMRPLVAFIGTSFTAVAGVATLANQWHRPSDVLAGLFVVAFWGCVAGAVLVRLTPAATLRRAPRLGPVLWVTVPCLIAAVIAFFWARIAAVEEPPGLVAAYIGGAAAVIGVCFLLAFAATHVFRAVR